MRTVTRTTTVAALGRRGVNHHLAQGQLVRLLPNIYCLAELAHNHRTRCHGLSLWGGGKVLIGGRSALYLEDSAFQPPVNVHAVIGLHDHVRAPDWAHVRHVGLPRKRRVSGGIQRLAADDAAIDAWQRTSPSRRERLCYEVLWRNLATAPQLLSAANGHARLKGRNKLEPLLNDFIDGAASPTEVIARREVFTGHAFANFEWQAEIAIAGRLRRADALHRDSLLVIECDGAEFHAGVEAWARDRERDAELAAAGYLTVRFSYRDLVSRPQWCREQVLSALNHRLLRT